MEKVANDFSLIIFNQVDESGEVVRNTWEDCEEGCPGTDFECNEGFLFNIEGECVNGTQAPGLLSRIGKTFSKQDKRLRFRR